MARVHLNNAGASLVSDATLRIMIDYLSREQQIGGYEAAAENKFAIDRFYDTAALLIGGQARNIAFVDSATRGWNTVLFSVPFRPGDNIVTTSHEFGSNVVSLQRAVELNELELRIIKVSEGGEIDLRQLDRLLDNRTRLVAMSHAPAHCGTVIDAAAVGTALAGHPAIFMLDACQTLGQMDVTVSEIGCDVLVGTGRKWLRGPRGTGFLYVSDLAFSRLNSISLDLANADWLPDPVEGSHLKVVDSAKQFQTWERSFAGQLAFTNAIDEYLAIREKLHIADRISILRHAVTQAIMKNEELMLFPYGNARSGVVTFYHRRLPSEAVKEAFAAKGINVSVIHDWDAPWDFKAYALPPLVRVSAHYFNTESDIEYFSAACGELT